MVDLTQLSIADLQENQLLHQQVLVILEADDHAYLNRQKRDDMTFHRDRVDAVSAELRKRGVEPISVFSDEGRAILERPNDGD